MGLDTLSEAITLSNLFLLPSEKGSTLKGKNVLPQGEGACYIESKQEVTEVVSPVKWRISTSVSSPLNSLPYLS